MMKNVAREFSDLLNLEEFGSLFETKMVKLYNVQLFDS
jgi:hypothetical protein